MSSLGALQNIVMPLPIKQADPIKDARDLNRDENILKDISSLWVRGAVFIREEGREGGEAVCASE